MNFLTCKNVEKFNFRKGIKILKRLFFQVILIFFDGTLVFVKKNEDELKKKRCFKILMPLHVLYSWEASF